MFIGRVYGDEPKSDGDLRIFEDGSPTGETIPSFRGIRALNMFDLNGDGQRELLVSDGWHYQYGTQARARLSLFLPPDYQQKVRIGDFADDYTINRIEVGKGKNAHGLVLAQASRHAYLLYLSEFGWRSLEVCEISEAGNTVFHYGNEKISILCSGRNAKRVEIQ